MPELATAWVTLAVATRGMETDVKRAFQRVENSAKLNPKLDTSKVSSQGDKAGRDFGSKFSASMERSVDGASGGGKAGSSFVGGFGEKIAGLGSKAGPIGLAIAAAAGTAFAGGKLVADQLFAGMEQQQAQANVQAKLGIDAPAMKQLADAAGRAYGENFGGSIAENMDAARVAIQSGLIPAGAGSSATQKMIEQLTTVSDVLGEDIPATAKAAQQAVRTGLAPNATAAFDLIVKGQQAGLNTSEDWLDTLNEYGTQFRKLGLSGEEATGLISQAMKGGARDSDVAADALKEFSIRAVDGSKATTGAYEALGLSADETAQKIAKGGPAARDAFGQVLTSIRAVKDPVQQSQLAVALFGTQAEDLGAAFNNFDLSTAVSQLGQVEGATQRASDTIGGTALSSWESFVRKIETAAGGMQQTLATAFGPLVTDLANSLSAHEPEVIGFFTKVAEVAAFGAESVVHFTADSSRALAQLVNAVGDTYGGITKVGARLKELTGDTEGAKQWYEEAERGFALGDSLYAVADSADAALKGVQGVRDRIGELGAQAQTAARLNVALGDAVAAVPDGKSITITDNTPETTERLKALGITVESTPTGLKLTATTDEAQRIIDSFIAQQTGKTAKVGVDANIGPAEATLGRFFANYQPKVNVSASVSGQVTAPNTRVTTVDGVPLPWQQGPLVGPPRAAGGLFDGMLPADAVLQRGSGSGLVQWAEAGTGIEAFIPIEGNRQRSLDIWAKTGQLLGVFEQGGLRGSKSGLQPNASQLFDLLAQAFPELQEIGGVRSDPIPDHPSGRALDIMIPNWESEQGKALGDQINTWLRENAGSLGVDSTIWRDTWADMAGNTSTVKGHQNHIHAKVNNGAATGASLDSYQALAASGDGTYEVDAQAVFDAESSVIKARNDLEEQRKQLTELEAKGTATESQLLAARNDVFEQERDVQSAEAKFTEAKQGKLKKTGKGSSSVMGGESLGQSIVGGIFESLGVPNFMNLFETPNAKSAMALANWGFGFLGGGESDESGPGGGGPLGGAMSGIGLPNLANVLKPIGPQALKPIDPNTTTHGQGAGAAPGGFGDAYHVTVQGNVGMDPRAFTDRISAAGNAAWRSRMSSTRPG